MLSIVVEKQGVPATHFDLSIICQGLCVGQKRVREKVREMIGLRNFSMKRLMGGKQAHTIPIVSSIVLMMSERADHAKQATEWHEPTEIQYDKIPRYIC